MDDKQRYVVVAEGRFGRITWEPTDTVKGFIFDEYTEEELKGRTVTPELLKAYGLVVQGEAIEHLSAFGHLLNGYYGGALAIVTALDGLPEEVIMARQEKYGNTFARLMASVAEQMKQSLKSLSRR